MRGRHNARDGRAHRQLAYEGYAPVPKVEASMWLKAKCRSREGESAGNHVRQAARWGASSSDKADSAARAWGETKTVSAGESAHRMAIHFSRPGIAFSSNSREGETFNA